MQISKRIKFITLLTGLLLITTSCWDSETENKIEDVGERIEEAADKTEDVAEDAADTVKDATN